MTISIDTVDKVPAVFDSIRNFNFDVDGIVKKDATSVTLSIKNDEENVVVASENPEVLNEILTYAEMMLA